MLLVRLARGSRFTTMRAPSTAFGLRTSAGVSLAPVAVGQVSANSAGTQRRPRRLPTRCALAVDRRSRRRRVGGEVRRLGARGARVAGDRTIYSRAERGRVARRVRSSSTRARVAAVVVVDTSLQSLGGAIDRFVRSGGGLILAGSSLTSPPELAPGSLSERVRPAVLPTDTIGLGSTGFYPVSKLKSDAVVLERRPAGIAIAARRVGAGRVVQLGYDDSWRWRMAGAAGSENAHREWWSRLVSSVAYAPPIVGASR